MPFIANVKIEQVGNPTPSTASVRISFTVTGILTDLVEIYAGGASEPLSQAVQRVEISPPEINYTSDDIQFLAGTEFFFHLCPRNKTGDQLDDHNAGIADEDDRARPRGDERVAGEVERVLFTVERRVEMVGRRDPPRPTIPRARAAHGATAGGSLSNGCGAESSRTSVGRGASVKPGYADRPRARGARSERGERHRSWRTRRAACTRARVQRSA